jgi:hypothetical protein
VRRCILSIALLATSCTDAPRADGLWRFERAGDVRVCRLDAGRVVVTGPDRAAVARAVQRVEARATCGAETVLPGAVAVVVAIEPRLSLDLLAELATRLAGAGAVAAGPVLVEPDGLAWTPTARIRLGTTDSAEAVRWLAAIEPVPDRPDRPSTSFDPATGLVTCRDAWTALQLAVDLRRAGHRADPLPLLVLP